MLLQLRKRLLEPPILLILSLALYYMFVAA